jgi:hypothetical protein
MPGATTPPPSASTDDDDRLLLARSQGLRLLRQDRLLGLLLGWGALGVVLVTLAQWLAGYPPERHIVLAVTALALGVAKALHQRGLREAALTALVFGVFLAVAAQTLVAGGLSTPALFTLPLLLMVAGALLGTRTATAMLLAMITLVCALALRQGPEALPPAAPGLRALVLGIVLLLVHVFLRAWQRSQTRDAQALAALNERLNAALQRERALRAESERLQQLLASCRSTYAETLAAQQGTQRLLLASMAPSARSAPPSLPNTGCSNFDLRELLRELVQDQAERLHALGLILDLEPDVRLQADAEALRAVVRAVLAAALQAEPRQIRLRAGLLGLDVIDLELVAIGLKGTPPPVTKAEQRAQLALQGTLSCFDEEEGTRWRLLMPRVAS